MQCCGEGRDLSSSQLLTSICKSLPLSEAGNWLWENMRRCGMKFLQRISRNEVTGKKFKVRKMSFVGWLKAPDDDYVRATGPVMQIGIRN